MAKLAVPAADQQQQEGVGDVRAEPGRNRMAFQVVHGHQRQVAGQGYRLAEAQAHHDPADQPRTRRGADPGDVVPGQAGV
jgi:hypothetical protein